MPYFIQNLRHIYKNTHEIQELAMYKYYGKWTEIDLHNNHLLENQIDEHIVVCIFQDIKSKS